MERIVHVAGKRKRAIARATLKEGSGGVRVNLVPLEVWQPEAARMRIEEPLLLASDLVDLNRLDIDVKVRGGGVFGQAEAVATSIARGLVKWSGSEELLRRYLNYNRALIAGDPRRTEPHKPSQSSKGPRHKRQKSYR